MGQNKQIQAGRGEWKGRKVRHKGQWHLWHTALRGVGGYLLRGQPAVRHAVMLQSRQRRQTQLQRVVAKNISHRPAHLGLLPVQQVPSGGGVQPVLQTYNLIAHEVNTAARIY